MDSDGRESEDRGDLQLFTKCASISYSNSSSEDDPKGASQRRISDQLPRDRSSSEWSSSFSDQRYIPHSGIIGSEELSHEIEKKKEVLEEVPVKEERRKGEPTTFSANVPLHTSGSEASELGGAGSNLPIDVNTTHPPSSASFGSIRRRGASPQKQLAFFSPQQETGEYVVSLQFLCNRKKILKLVLDKSSRSLTTQHMRLAIRTIFSPRFPSHASLMLNFTPYVVEQTKWPQRFCRLSVHLKIPPNCVVPMTVYHTCTLTFSVHVSSSHPIGKKNDLLDYQYPLKYNFRVPEGNSELVVTDIQTVRHTSLFDATCKNIKFEIFGKLDFEEVAMPEYHFIDPQDDNGFVEIVPNK